MKSDITKLQEIIDVQCSEGNYDYDPYMLGLANGLICAMAVLAREEPHYLGAPKVWGKDKPDDGKPPAIHNQVETEK